MNPIDAPPDVSTPTERGSEITDPKPRSDQRVFAALLIGFLAMGLVIAMGVPLFLIPDESAHWELGNARTEILFGNGTPDCVKFVTLDDWFELQPLRGAIRPKKLIQGRYQTLASMPLACSRLRPEYGDWLSYPGVVASKLIWPGQTKSALRQVEGIFIARILQGIMVFLCLLRLGQLARKGHRTGLLLIGGLCLLPLLVQQSFGVSSDGVGLGFALVLVGVVLFWERLGWVDFGLFAFLGWGASAKPFALFCMVAAVFVGYLYGLLRREGSAGLSVRGLLADFLKTVRPRLRSLPPREGLFFWAALALVLATVVRALFHLGAVGVSKPGVDGAAQMAFVKTHIWQFLTTVPSDDIWKALWGVESWASPLGWLDAFMDKKIFPALTKLLTVLLVLEVVQLIRRSLGPARPPSPFWSRLVRVTPPFLFGLFAAVASFYSVVFILYMRWTPVGRTHVEGFQMRYLFPTLLFFVAVIAGAVEILVGPKRQSPEPLVNGPGWRRVVSFSWNWLPALWVLAFQLPQVTRVFLSLMARYH
jgi:hypothetical protein